MSRSLEGTKTAVALPHCSESTGESNRRVVRFWIDGVAGVVAELRNVVQADSAYPPNSFRLESNVHAVFER